MAKDQDEIEDDDLDTEDNIEDEDEEDEDEDADDADDENEDADDSDEEDDEDDDSDEEDSDDEDPLPKTRKELNAVIAKAAKAAVKASRNRDGASRRTSKKGIPDRKGRSSREDPRIASLEQTTRKLELTEAKREFGHQNDLTPDEVDLVFRFSKKPTAKTLRDPAIQGALNGHRTARRAKANIPGSSGLGRPSKVNAREEKNMTPAEKKQRFIDRRKGYLAAKR